MFTTTVYIGDIELEVEFSATELKPAKLSGAMCDSRPEEGGEVEIEEIRHNGVDISEIISEKSMTTVFQKCSEYAAEALADKRDSDMCDAVEARNSRNG